MCTLRNSHWRLSSATRGRSAPVCSNFMSLWNATRKIVSTKADLTIPHRDSNPPKTFQKMAIRKKQRNCRPLTIIGSKISPAKPHHREAQKYYINYPLKVSNKNQNL